MDIRVAREADAAGIQAIYAPVVTETAISFETEPPGVAEMARRVAETLPEHPWLVLDDAGAILGYAYGHRFAARAAYLWSVETSVYLRPEARGRGAGRALYAALIAILRA
ncbi:MAG TPA: GNAT family N-acetyltransferase, partial [Acidimicrobiales bacterium]|nr:GNAT family N-acetyltransferase [Acidimicrobiales bacterium]